MVLGGLLFGLAGIGLLIESHLTHGLAPASVVAMALAMLGAFSWACATLAVPRLKFTESAVMASAMQMMLGGGCLLAISLLAGQWQGFSIAQVSRPSAIAFILLVFLPSVAGYPIYNWLLETIDPALVSTFAYVNPVVAIILGWAAAGEALTAATLLSTSLLVIGVVFITRAQGRPAAANPVTRVPDEALARAESCRKAA
jgi:drug/metabolite transporter (DMT)-like permease